MRYICIVFFCLCFVGLRAQGTKSGNTSRTPSWVQMMEDPGTNYYTALKAFDTYWKGKELPIEEDDVLTEEQSSREKKEHRKAVRKLKNMTPAERQQYDYLVYQYKRFMNWKREVFPFVQEDGRILTQQEREAIWEQQQKEAANRSKN